MSLNPVQFGTEVIDQFGRYLMTTFPIADPRMERQVRRHLKHDVGGERLIAKGPYVYINRPFEQGQSVASLCSEEGLGLHPVLKRIFTYDAVHKHQELALRAVKDGKNIVVATGTGSGKTEAFLLPIVDHALHLRDASEHEGVIAVIVYPMNALADDQLRRLRPLLAGTGITFGRYTGVTLEDSEPEQGRLKEMRAYHDGELQMLSEGKEESVPIPFEECFNRQELQRRKPRILLTNYSQLEYLLLRDRDLDLFRNAPLKFMVFDEVHTYTGALGSEVACLIRRLRHVARKRTDEVICIGTSATVQESDAEIDAEAGHDAEGAKVFPLVLCRSCGQHYFSRLAEESINTDGVGVQLTSDPGQESDAEIGESVLVYVTNRLVGRAEDDADIEAPQDAWICCTCGTLHNKQVAECRNGKCGRKGTLLGVASHRGTMKICLACGTAAKGYEEVVTPVRSSEVADVNILAQSMLTAMREESLQKLLVFTDNRRDAAFQAGWMEERSRRFRLRHLLYATLAAEPGRTWSLEKLTERIVDLAKERQVLPFGDIDGAAGAGDDRR